MAAICLALATTAHAQPGAVDLTFDPGSTTDGEVLAIAQQADGKFLIGGSFTVAESGVRGRIARVNTDGSLDKTFGAESAGADRPVRSVALQTDGKVLIGGQFTNVNGTARNGVARLNLDGSLDASFGTDGSGILGLVRDAQGLLTLPTLRCVAIQPDGKVVIGGAFTNVNGVGRQNIARLNADGSLDTEFATTAQGEVYSIAVQTDGKILLAGKFSAINNVTRYHMARLYANGSLQTNFLTDIPYGINGYVYAMALQGDGKIVIGGDFTTFDISWQQWVTRNRIARLNSDGTVDTGFGAGAAGVNGPVYAVAVATDGKVLLGGNFSSVNGLTCYRLARLTANGSLDSTFQNGIATVDYPLWCLLTQTGGGFLAGGGFRSANESVKYALARFNSNGSLDTSFGTRPYGLEGYIEFVRPQQDGKVLVAGYFTNISGISRHNLARFNVDGSVDPTFGAAFPRVSGGTVRTIASQADGKLLIGGSFEQVNGTARYGIARLNQDGSLDSTFSAALSGTGDWIRSIIVQSTGKIIIAGHFGWVNTILRDSIARLNADGSLDGSFGNADGARGGIRSVALQPDNKLVIGGDFYEVQGVPRNYIARLNPNGLLDASFGAGQAGASYPVYAVALQPDGKIVIGGGFINVNNAPRAGIARLNSDGSLDPDFGADLSGVDGYVYSLALQRDGKIVIGGYFKSVNDTPRNGLARLNPDGTLDTTFAEGLPGITGSVYSLALQGDERVLLSGGFSGVHQAGRSHIARLYGDHPPLGIVRSGPLSIRLFWALSWTGFGLQEATTGPDSFWRDLADPPTNDGTNWLVLRPRTNESQLYRLKK